LRRKLNWKENIEDTEEGVREGVKKRNRRNRGTWRWREKSGGRKTDTKELMKNKPDKRGSLLAGFASLRVPCCSR